MYRTVPALCNRPEKKLNAQFVRYDGFHVIKPVYFHHQFRIRKLTIQEVKSYIAFAASKLLQGTNPSDEVRRNKFKRLRMRIKLREENSFITIPKANHSLLGLFTLCYASSLTQDVGGRALLALLASKKPIVSATIHGVVLIPQGKDTEYPKK